MATKEELRKIMTGEDWDIFKKANDSRFAISMRYRLNPRPDCQKLYEDNENKIKTILEKYGYKEQIND